MKRQKNHSARMLQFKAHLKTEIKDRRWPKDQPVKKDGLKWDQAKWGECRWE